MLRSVAQVSLLTSLIVAAAACDDSVPPLQTAQPGVVFTSPSNGQIDVPLGTRIVVTFSDPVVASALGSCTASDSAATGGLCLVGPNGPVADVAEVAGDPGTSVQFTAPALEPGTTYQVFASTALSPAAANLLASGPLFSFTTRAVRPRAAAPTVVAVDGSDPAHLGTYRPMTQSSTIHLVFSEPLADATVFDDPSSVVLLDATGTRVPATVIASGIHVAIDPVADLTAGSTYQLQLGAAITDLGGTPLAPVTFALTPSDSVGRGITKQVLRTWKEGDVGAPTTRSGATRNAIVIDKPLIGRETTTLLPSTLQAELGDPNALGGPIAFTIRRGQRLSASGLDIKLGGTIPSGLATGNVLIELLTDGGGRIYRNPYQPADQRPEEARSPLYVDMVLDLAVYAVDPAGNAVLSQTVLGVEASGTVSAGDGVLAIETVGSMELGLLGVTVAPTNLVLELITDPAAQPAVDTEPPMVLSAPGADDVPQAVGAGLDLVFDEPVDLDRARAGGLKLQTAAGQDVPAVIESHGAAVVIQPIGGLAYSTSYNLVLSDVADVAGNALASTTLSFTTAKLGGTDVPLTVAAVSPGVPCALTGTSGADPGRCEGGKSGDDSYHPFTLPANQDIEVVFTQPVQASTLTHGAACGQGSVRVEALDGAACSVVPGTFIAHDHGVSFVADQPWTEGAHYRLTLHSGTNKNCDSGEICGGNGKAASFDPLNGAADSDASGGNDLVIYFDGAPATKGTFMFAGATPATDVNGSGYLDSGEVASAANSAGLSITDTGGAVSNASFQGTDCNPGLPGTQACMYLAGSMPVSLGDVMQSCPLPDGTTAPSCIPVTMSAQAMYATSVTLKATVGISINTDTGGSVMRIREPADGPVMGYIVDDGGMPVLVAQLSLYMDAPDMNVTLSDHDLHSKPLIVSLKGPVTFLPDGRIAIALANVADVPVTVNIDAPLGISGSVTMSLVAGQMKLQLVSPPVRGGAK